MLEKTSVNKLWPAIKTFINPLTGATGSGHIWKPSGFNPTGTESYDKLLFKTLALSTTYGSFAFLIKALANKRAELDRKKKEQLAGEALQASSAIISPDPNLKDIAEEARLKNIGLVKQANIFGEAWTQTKNLLSKVIGPTTSADPWTLVVPAVAALAAVGGGIYAADRLDNMRRKALADKRLLQARNEMDALNNAKLLMARGKTPAGLNKILSRSYVSKEAGGEAKDYKNLAYAVLALTAISSGALGYMATKEFMDRRDPRRMKQKLLNEELKRVELKQGMGTPKVTLDIDPSTAGKLDEHITGSPRRQLLMRPTTGAVNIEPATGRAPTQRDLLAL